jgi:hypothetical protein
MFGVWDGPVNSVLDYYHSNCQLCKAPPDQYCGNPTGHIGLGRDGSNFFTCIWKWKYHWIDLFHLWMSIMYFVLYGSWGLDYILAGLIWRVYSWHVPSFRAYLLTRRCYDEEFIRDMYMYMYWPGSWMQLLLLRHVRQLNTEQCNTPASIFGKYRYFFLSGFNRLKILITKFYSKSLVVQRECSSFGFPWFCRW